MIFEHEIPSSSRLYFGKSAKLKREIEQISANSLEQFGFSEMKFRHPYFRIINILFLTIAVF